MTRGVGVQRGFVTRYAPPPRRPARIDPVPCTAEGCYRDANDYGDDLQLCKRHRDLRQWALENSLRRPA